MALKFLSFLCLIFMMAGCAIHVPGEGGIQYHLVAGPPGQDAIRNIQTTKQQTGVSIGDVALNSPSYDCDGNLISETEIYDFRFAANTLFSIYAVKEYPQSKVAGLLCKE